MVEALLGITALAALLGFFFSLIGRFIEKAQAEDRSYGGENDSGAGSTGMGDTGPL